MSDRVPEGTFLALTLRDSTPPVGLLAQRHDVRLCALITRRVDHGPSPGGPRMFTASASRRPERTAAYAANIKAAGAAVDRVQARLLISPVGRPLLEFKSFTQLLRAPHATIQGHRYMYERHRVLRRDVSYGNIMLLPELAYGVLIDFDPAIPPDLTNHGAGNRTGTPDPLAVDILLEDVPHNPRHNLESSFYVLLWLCTEWVRDEATGKMELRTHTFFSRPVTGDLPMLQSVGIGKNGVISTLSFFGKHLKKILDPPPVIL
jgi:hypothetical protein